MPTLTTTENSKVPHDTVIFVAPFFTAVINPSSFTVATLGLEETNLHFDVILKVQPSE